MKFEHQIFFKGLVFISYVLNFLFFFLILSINLELFIIKRNTIITKMLINCKGKYRLIKFYLINYFVIIFRGKNFQVIIIGSGYNSIFNKI